eukprot:1141025-Pelagomonas_calceolata.AAC.2
MVGPEKGSALLISCLITRLCQEQACQDPRHSGALGSRVESLGAHALGLLNLDPLIITLCNPTSAAANVTLDPVCAS